MNAADLKQAWQAAPATHPLPAIDDLRHAATRFDRRIRRRNAVEYGAAALVSVLFGAFAVLMPLPIPAMRIGAVLIVIAAAYVAWQLHRRASALPLSPGMPVIAHHRAALARQRDALASVGRWYLAPFLPGLILVLFGPIIHGGADVIAAIGWRQVPVFAGSLLIFGGVWWINRRAAATLSRMIQDLDMLQGDQE
jgi:hypothetical protein